ncbi:MAG: stage II sporulation protein P [Clostridia bacterium]|nr:stage II sporulation protein P [Clostridia bacterium]
MYKRKKNFDGVLLPLLLAFICFLTNKINIPVSTDINKILPEIFSVAAVNANYKRTGVFGEIRDITNFLPEAEIKPQETVQPPAEEPEIEVVEKKVTYAENTENKNGYEKVFLTNHTDYDVNLSELMNGYAPPKRKDDVQILIIHTHATEGYADSKGSRTTETDKNMIAVGNVFSDALKEKGFKVVHDIKLHDYPSYNGSYANSLKVMNWYIEHYPDIDIIFDLHRDAVGDSDEQRVKFVTEINGKKAAQLMLVTGTNEGGLNHPSWQENLKFAAGLQNVVCNMYPDLMRAVDLRKERFNQHVTKNSIIVEVGSNGNSIEEAKYSVTLLAEALDKYIT